MPFTAISHSGILHGYAPRLAAFEHTPSTTVAHNFVLFLGGLSDSLLTVRYPSVLASLLPPTWSLAETQLSSSGVGWTTGTLTRDASELAKAIAYFRDLGAQRSPGATSRIVLLGHSTGCQIATNYLVGDWREPLSSRVTERPAVSGVVLQSGISDREGVAGEFHPAEVARSLEIAREWVREGRGGDQLPRSVTKGVFGANVSAERWVSLVDAEGEDDYFSSDLGESRVERVWGAGGFGGRGVRVMVLIGGSDEHMPGFVNKEGLVARWEGKVKGAGGAWDERSGVVEGAGHNLNRNGEEVVKGLCERIVGFVGDVEKEGVSKDGGKL